MKSIIDYDKEHVCFNCGGWASDVHHIFSGTANRRQSERYGLKVWLCRQCHEEAHRGGALNRHLRYIAQAKFEETHTRQEFIKIFGKNWRY